MPKLDFKIIEELPYISGRWQLQVLLNGVVVDELIWLDAVQMIALKQCLEDWVEEHA